VNDIYVTITYASYLDATDMMTYSGGRARFRLSVSRSKSFLRPLEEKNKK